MYGFTPLGSFTRQEPSEKYSDERNKVLVSVEIVLFTIRNGVFEVLVLKRNSPPFLDFWELPGGLIRLDIGQRGESADDAALRELTRAAGLTGTSLRYLEQLGTYGDPERDPREERSIAIAYMGIGANVAEPPEQNGASFVPVSYVEDELSNKLAFDHSIILTDAISKARMGVEYSRLAAGFCASFFHRLRIKANSRDNSGEETGSWQFSEESHSGRRVPNRGWQV